MKDLSTYRVSEKTHFLYCRFAKLGLRICDLPLPFKQPTCIGVLSNPVSQNGNSESATPCSKNLVHWLILQRWPLLVVDHDDHFFATKPSLHLTCIYHYPPEKSKVWVYEGKEKMSTDKARWIYGGKWAPYGSFVHHMALTALPPFSLHWLGNFLAYALTYHSALFAL